MEKNQVALLKERMQTIRQVQDQLCRIDKELGSLILRHRSMGYDLHKAFSPTQELSNLPEVSLKCNLVAAVSQLSQQWLQQSIKITFNVMGRPIHLDLPQGAMLFQCIQTYIWLSIKHLLSFQILIELTFYVDTVEFYIENDGTALDLSDRTLKSIWKGLTEKVRFMNGTLQTNEYDGNGNSISCVIPILDNAL